MSSWLKSHGEKIVFALALLILVGSAGWSWRLSATIRRTRALPVRVQPDGSDYVSAASPSIERAPVIWPDPTEQSAGHGWIYELFSPPPIFYNRATKTFAVASATEPAAGAHRCPLELVAVEPELFRLQLAGYIGGSDDVVAAFVEPGRPDVVLARPGRRLADLNLTVKSIEVRKVPREENEAGLAVDVAALAVLLDEETGTEVTLDSRFRRFTTRTFAVLRILSDGGRRCRLSEGESILAGGVTYVVEQIQLDPPEVTVEWQTAGPLQAGSTELRPFPSSANPNAGRLARRNLQPGGATAELAATNGN